MQIKNKENELKSRDDDIRNLNLTIETLKLKFEKEVAECQRLSEELSKMNNNSKIWTSEKSALERQVCYFILFS